MNTREQSSLLEWRRLKILRELRELNHRLKKVEKQLAKMERRRVVPDAW